MTGEKRTIGTQELTDKATERARELIDVTMTHSGYEPTEDERRLVALGANLGIATTIETLKAYSVAGHPSR
jgi:hypothetical protein